MWIKRDMLSPPMNLHRHTHSEKTHTLTYSLASTQKKGQVTHIKHNLNLVQHELDYSIAGLSIFTVFHITIALFSLKREKKNENISCGIIRIFFFWLLPLSLLLLIGVMVADTHYLFGYFSIFACVPASFSYQPDPF